VAYRPEPPSAPLKSLHDDPQGLVEELQDQFPKAHLIGGDTEFELLVAQVVGFVEQPSLGLNLPLDVQGTAFQERVWQAPARDPPRHDRQLP
jgi:AraC family transcriptional regulator of adaptative response/methylated-DNA-[protein]-cysteine methyltransferase